jgi:hypothetical protein
MITVIVPEADYNFRKDAEEQRANNIGTNITQTTNSRKVPYTTDYDMRKEIEHISIIDEINRQNLYSDYGV